MSGGEMLWTIALCGVGTFLLRWLPLWRVRQRGGAGGAGGSAWQKWLSGVGPAAIAALLAVSVAGLLPVAGDGRAGKAAAIALALACTAAARKLLGGGVAVPTLAGALVYGLLAQWGWGAL